MLKVPISIVGAGVANCVLTGTAGADDPDVDCNNAMTQSDMTDCAHRDFREADDEMNADFKKIFEKLHDNEKLLFQQSQQAWEKFRDDECEFRSSFTEGGSVQPMVHADCLAWFTVQRVKDLQYYLTCEEGDMSCPFWVQQ